MNGPEHDRGRPGERAASNVTAGDKSSLPLTRSDRADLALRCAWLRVHADLLRPIDTTGQLSAQLLDLADLLEWRWS